MLLYVQLCVTIIQIAIASMADQEAQSTAVVDAPASHQEEVAPAPALAANLHNFEPLPEDGVLESVSSLALSSLHVLPRPLTS